MSPQDILAVYQRFGFPLLYWERRGNDSREWKGPHGLDAIGWNDRSRRYPLDLFDGTRHNLGVFTGCTIAPGRHLADIDMDWADGIVLAKRLLPSTGFGLGRKGKRLSHALYTADAPFGVSTYYDVTDNGSDGNGVMLVELRMGDYTHQTMLVPSLHTPPDTFVELVQWESIGHYDLSRLRDSALDKAIGCLLLKRVSGGLHHDGRLALAGFLLKHDFAPERVTNLLEAICEAQAKALVSDMSGKDVADCRLVVESTWTRVSEQKKVKGGPAFAAFCGTLGPAIVERLAQWLGIEDTDTLILDPNDTRRSARIFVGANYTVNDTLALRRQAGVFYSYQPKLGAYDALADETVRAELYSFLEVAKARTKDGELTDFRPNRSKVSDVLDAFNALTNLDPSLKAPRWLANDPGLNPLDILSCPNVLLHIPTRTLLPPTPDFYTLNGIDCAYDADAPTPTQWLTFLNQLWGAADDEPGDPESIDTLQEIFGYLLCPDTHFQKLFSIIGPKRSGKSLIGRVLARLGGERNTCSPTLASFGDQFGKQGLIGKTLSIIGDARISGRSDSASVAETLLGISGEDPQTVQRKNLPDWNGKLSTRFLLLANEPPKIEDISGALAARFIMLVLTRSFYGKEDLTLFDKLAHELPGILNWALVGRDRLYQRRFFLQPESGKTLVEELENLSSPVGAMLNECTTRTAGAWVSHRRLFEVWTRWCVDNGRKHAGTKQTFGRDVRTARPWIKSTRQGSRGQQERGWEGLELVADWATRVPPEDEQPPLRDEEM